MKVLVDGRPHNVVAIEGGGMFLDHPDYPDVRCSFHRMHEQTISALLNDSVTVRTNGHVYTSYSARPQPKLAPSKPPEKPVHWFSALMKRIARKLRG